MAFTGIELTYAVRSDFREPELAKIQLSQPVTAHLGDFEVTVEPDADGAALTARTTEPFDSVRAAEEDLAPRLDAWAAEIYFMRGFPLRFGYAGGRPLVDDVVAGTSEGTATVTFSAQVADRLDDLPDPSEDFALSDAVQAIYSAWRDWREGRSRLATAAYWTYTVLTTEYNVTDPTGPDRTGIDREVLKKLNKLSSRWHPEHGRKYLDADRNDPLTPAEIAWLQAVIPAIAQQLARVRPGRQLSARLRMTDLPQLP